MKKSLSILFVVFLIGCGAEKSKQQKAKDLLENGYYSESYAIYKELSEEGKKTCEVLYGKFLSITLDFLREAIGGGRSLASEGFGALFPIPSPQMLKPDEVSQGNIDAIVTNFLIPIDEFMVTPAIEAANEVIENKCNFVTNKGIEFLLSVVPERKIWIGKDFRTYHAYLIRAFLHILKGGLNFISSHNLDMSFDRALEFYNSTTDIVNLAETDIAGLLRSAGVLIESAPNFLSFSDKPERKALFSNVNNELSYGLSDFAEFLTSFFINPDEPDEKRKDNLLGYVDANGDGAVNSGDEIYIGILDYWDENGEPFKLFGEVQNSFPIVIGPTSLFNVIFLGIGNEFISNAVNFLRELSLILTGEKKRAVELSEFNQIIPFGIDFFPDGVTVVLSRLIPDKVEDALPLRRFLPVFGTYDPPGGDGTKLGDPHTIFLVEGEVGEKASSEYYFQEVTSNDPTNFCYTCPPGSHFKSIVYSANLNYFKPATDVSEYLIQLKGSDEIQEIPDDCIEPGDIYEVMGAKIPLLYFYWQDPSFNKSIYIDLSQISDPSNNCYSIDQNYIGAGITANNYSLNKMTASFIANLLATLSSFQLFTSQ